MTLYHDYKRKHAVFYIFLLCSTPLFAERSAPVTEPSSTAGIEKRLQNIERLLQNQGLLDMLQQIQQLQQEVTTLRGQLEVNNHELANLKEKQRKLYNDLDQRLQSMQTGSPLTESVVTPDPPLETMPTTESVVPAGEVAGESLVVENTDAEGIKITQLESEPMQEPGLDERPGESQLKDDPLLAQSEYQAAFNLLRNAEYDRAIVEFDKFLVKFPDSQYSDNAQYWMGEAYFVTRRFNEAITEYMKLVSNFPESQKAPNSLLKIGYSYIEMGKKEEAEKIFQEVIKQFPDSAAAADAKRKLDASSAS